MTLLESFIRIFSADEAAQVASAAGRDLAHEERREALTEAAGHAASAVSRLLDEVHGERALSEADVESDLAEALLGTLETLEAVDSDGSRARLKRALMSFLGD